MPPIKIGLLGYGTVAQGVFQLWRQNREEIEQKLGLSWEITMVARRAAMSEEEISSLAPTVVTQDPKALVNHPDIDIVVELIGGTDAAKDLILQAIKNGKSVVTANKKLLAEYGNEIFAAASAAKVGVKFEAAVAGGIPIIKVLKESLAANKIHWLAGIINGTSNFILSEMKNNGTSFAAALKEAQSLGYAEADPTFDIRGDDAGHKIAILSALAFGTPINFKACYLEGIDKLHPKDIAYALELGYRVKLLALTRKTKAGIELRVHPALIPKTQLLAHVDGVMNAIYVDSDMLGRSLYYGAGAGGAPTASAVVADLMDLSRDLKNGVLGADANFITPSGPGETRFISIDETTNGYYLRFWVKDEVGVLSRLTQIFANHEVSIEVMEQKTGFSRKEGAAELVILTHTTLEKKVLAVINAVEASHLASSPVVMIRIESFSH